MEHWSAPPFMCVLVVCREQPRLLGLTEVLQLIEAFVDTTAAWSVGRACRLPSLRLVQRLWGRLPARYQGDPFYRQWQFSAALPIAVASGDCRLVGWLVSSFSDCRIPAQALGEAATHGCLKMLQWLLAEGVQIEGGGNEVEKALKAKHGKLAVWLTENMPSSLESASVGKILPLAAANGDVELVQWALNLLNKEFGDTLLSNPRRRAIQEAVNIAARSGCVRVLEWFFNSGIVMGKVRIGYRYMADGCRLGLMQWIYCHYPRRLADVDSRTTRYAAKRGHLAMLQWLDKISKTLSYAGALDDAVRHGHCDAARWLYSVKHSNFRAMDSSLHGAAQLGALETLQWIDKEFAVTFATRVMDGAASEGQIHVVRWLNGIRTRGCTTEAMNGAASNGHLDMVKWLHQHRTEGCTVEAMDGAARNGHLSVVQWLHANRTEGCTARAMDGAAEGGHLAIVKWLHENRSEGCTTHAMDAAAVNGYLEVVKWLHENRSEGCTTQAMDAAADNGHLEVVKWLHLHRAEGCTVSAMDLAAASFHFDVVLFLHEERSEGCSARAIAACKQNGHDVLLPWFELYYPDQR